jgi:hypothetical protein
MNYAEFEQTINRKQIVDALAQNLYAFGVVPHDQDITNIQFSDLFGASTEEFCKIKIFTQQEVVQ